MSGTAKRTKRVTSGGISSEYDDSEGTDDWLLPATKVKESAALSTGDTGKSVFARLSFLISLPRFPHY